MHIAFIDSICNPDHPGVGGLSDINWRLARELCAAGQRVTVVGAYTAEAASPDSTIACVAVPQAVVQHNNLARHMVRAARLAHAAQQLDPVDVFHVPDSLTAAALAALGLGAQVVWHGHLNIALYAQQGIRWDTSMYTLMRVATAFAARRVSRMIALGPGLVPWWERVGFPRERISVIPNGVDLPADERQPTAWSSPEAWNNRTYRLLYVGRLSAQKGGHFELIDAVAALSQDLSLGLVMIGDGLLRPRIERLLKERGLTQHITCVGYQQPAAVHQYYRQADLVVLPSRGEMMPRVMLEAWATGVAFMGSAVGAVPDYLADNQNGFLLSSLEQQYFRSRLHDALSNPALRARVATGGLATARTLTWPRVASQFQDVYQAVIAERNTGRR